MIRLLEERDIDDCLRLMDLVEDDFAGYKEDEFVRAMHVAIANKEAFVVHDGGEIVGLIAFAYSNHEITFLAVHPRHRRRGIAENLVNRVKSCFQPGVMLHVVTFRCDGPKGKAAVACRHSCGFKDGELLEAYGYPCQRMAM